MENLSVHIQHDDCSKSLTKTKNKPSNKQKCGKVGVASLTTCSDPLTNRFMATEVIFTNKITAVVVLCIPKGHFLLLFFHPPLAFLNVLIFWMGGLAGGQLMVSAYLHQSSESLHKTFRPLLEKEINKYAYMKMKAFITVLCCTLRHSLGAAPSTLQSFKEYED